MLTFFAALLCLLGGQLLFALNLPATAGFATPLGAVLHLLGMALGWWSFHDEASARLGDAPPRRFQRMTILAVVLMAGVLRLVWLDTVPFRIDGDAAAFAAAADDFLRPKPPPLIGTGWQSHTNLYFFLESLALRMFGYSALGLRFFGALGGTLSVLTIYALGRSLWNFWVGFWAALITAVLPFHLVFSRVGTEVIHVSWQLPLVLWSVWQGWTKHDWRWSLLGGCVTGLSQYFYPGARLIPLLVVAQIGLLTLLPPAGSRSWRRGVWGLLWFGIGALAIYGPIIPYFLRRPEIYTARMSAVNIFSSGWFASELADYPWWFVIGDQLRRAYVPFVFPLDGPALWYVWPQYLGPFDAALFVLGLIGIWAGSSTPRWLKLFLAIYLGVGIFLAGVLTIDTPMPSRYVIFIPAVSLCIGYTLDRLLHGPRRPLPRPHRAIVWSLMLGAIGLYVSSGIASYLKHDTEAIWEQDQTGQMGTLAARYLQTLPEQDFEIFFLQTEWMYYEASPALAFLTDKPGYNIKKELTCRVIANVMRKPRAVFIAPSERLDELRAISKQLMLHRAPSGHGTRLEVLHNPLGDEIVGILQVQQPSGNAPWCVDPPDS